MSVQPLRIFTWNVNPCYLSSLAQTRHEFYIPFDETRAEPASSRSPSCDLPSNVIPVSLSNLRKTQLDCVLYQSKRNFLSDQFEILTNDQLKLPRIYLEHDPPRDNATDAKHPACDDDLLLVHVTHFNDLMWDVGDTRTSVIEPGVVLPDDVVMRGDVDRGLVIADDIRRRGRRAGSDIWDRARAELPLDLVGAGWKEASGLDELSPSELPYLIARYRLLFDPARHGNLSLGLCQAMMIGLPIVGLATGDLATVVENGVSGYSSNDVCFLIEAMRELLHDPGLAHCLGAGARRLARERFDIRRFVDDWNKAFRSVTGATGFHQATSTRTGATNELGGVTAWRTERS